MHHVNARVHINLHPELMPRQLEEIDFKKTIAAIRRRHNRAAQPRTV